MRLWGEAPVGTPALLPVASKAPREARVNYGTGHMFSAHEGLRPGGRVMETVTPV